MLQSQDFDGFGQIVVHSDRKATVGLADQSVGGNRDNRQIFLAVDRLLGIPDRPSQFRNHPFPAYGNRSAANRTHRCFSTCPELPDRRSRSRRHIPGRFNCRRMTSRLIAWSSATSTRRPSGPRRFDRRRECAHFLVLGQRIHRSQGFERTGPSDRHRTGKSQLGRLQRMAPPPRRCRATPYPWVPTDCPTA